MSKNSRVLVVIPAHNEEQTIAQVVLRIRHAIPDFDRVIVNDGSTDATGDIVSQLGERQLSLPCNLGYGWALQTGLKYALKSGYEIIVFMDADGQHKPEDVPRLVETLLSSKVDMVIGSRFCADDLYRTSFMRRTGQWLFSYLTRLLVGRRIYDTTSGFKALTAAAGELLVRGTFMDFHAETIVRLSLLGFKIAEYPVTMDERFFGRSMHSFKSVFQYPLKTIVLAMVAAMDAYLIRRAR
jgi:glycosyltransferase involved in cell wall biosynthesis